jgi:hypothetical protein
MLSQHAPAALGTLHDDADALLPFAQVATSTYRCVARATDVTINSCRTISKTDRDYQALENFSFVFARWT